jgi:enoyl-CoA hydratase/carnithine racemase
MERRTGAKSSKCESAPLLCEILDGIAILTLNRPEKLNAINYEMIDRLLFSFDELEIDSKVRGVIMTGAGRAFSSGADIHEFASDVQRGPEVALREFVQRGQTMTSRVEAFCKPVIVAVNGLAFGGGCEITEAAHLAIASNTALFAKPEVKLGMLPTFGGSQRLPRLAGRKRALELLLTGEPFSPEKALELGLINRIVPHQALLASAFELIRVITRHSSAAITSIIASVNQGINFPIERGLRVEADQFVALTGNPALREGLAAWKQRRTRAGEQT